MYLLLAIVVQVLLFSVDFSQAGDTTCEESEKHFANLCFSPKPSGEVNFTWAIGSQPADGWHTVQGNDVTRLHLSEILKGKLLSFNDNFDNLCFRARVDHSDDTTKAPDGKYFGYGNLTAEWNCTYSKDFYAVLMCEFDSRGVSKYHDSFNFYTSYSDNKNLMVAILCFPNGQVGWMGLSLRKSLTDDEKKTVSDHVTAIGFSNENTVDIYDESKCS